MSVGRHPDVHGNLILTAPCAAQGGGCSGGWSGFEHSDGWGGPLGLPWRGLDEWLHEPQIYAASSDGGTSGCGGWHLPSLGLDVSLVAFYNSFSSSNGGSDGTGLKPALGYRWRMSTDLRLQASLELPTVVTLTRGDGHAVQYRDEGCGQYKAITPGCFNTLEQDYEEGLWLERTPDGRVSAYPLNIDGKSVPISKVRDSVGNVHHFNYDSDGLLLSLADAVGRSINFSYSAGLLSSVTDWAGRTMSFGYVTSPDGKPLLVQVTGAEGCITSYHYEMLGTEIQLVGVQDAQGYETYYNYDDKGRAVTRTVAGEGGTVYTYLSGQATLTDAESETTVHWVNEQGNWTGWSDALGHGWSFGRNGQEQITQISDPSGGFSRYSYDAQTGCVLSVMDAVGRVTDIKRDSYNNPVRISHPGSEVESLTWVSQDGSFDSTGEKRRLQMHLDALQHPTKYLYDGRGLLMAQEDALSHTTGYSYDGYGRLTGVTDALGHTSGTSYDAAGNVLSSSDALGHTWNFTYDHNGNVLSSTGPASGTVNRKYDSLGRKVSEVDALGYSTGWEHNIFDKPSRLLDAASGETLYGYDHVGRLVWVRDPLLRITNHHYDAAGRLEETIDPLLHSTTFQYDEVGRPTLTTDPNHISTGTRYNSLGQAEATKDGRGFETGYRYDPMGRLLETRDPLGYLTTNHYDASGRLLDTTDARQAVTRYAYDDANRRTGVQDPNGNVTSYKFDEANRLTDVQDALGHVSTNVYDVANRLTDVLRPLGRNTHYEYDGENRQTAVVDAQNGRTDSHFNVGGQLQEMVDANRASTKYLYDPLGRHISVENALHSVSTTHYNVAGEVDWEQDFAGAVTSYRYDTASRLIETTAPLNRVTSYEPDPGGRVTAVRDPKGHFTRTVYNENGQPLSARWFLRVDDDSVTDVGGLLSHLDGSCDWREPHHLIGHLCSEVNPAYEKMLRQVGAGHLLCPRGRALASHEWEVSLTSQPAMLRALSHPQARELLSQAADYEGGFGDQCLALCHRLAGLFPEPASFLSSFEHLDDFSLWGGGLFHIHYLSPDKPSEWARFMDKLYQFGIERP